jgi:hypothetical protein
MIGLPVDNIVSPGFYNDIQFDKWIGYASFASGYGLANNSERGYLGSAVKIGSTYVGVYYGGNFGYGYFRPDFYEMDVKGDTNPKGGAGGWSTDEPDGYKSFKVFQMPYGSTSDFQFDIFDKDVKSNESKHRNDNRVMVLVGIADMGFRLGYASTHTSYTGTDVAVEYDKDPLPSSDPSKPPVDTPVFYYYKDFSIAHGWIIPSLAWSMARDLTPRGIRPSLSIDWGIAQNYSRYSDYKKDGETVQYSRNYMEPVITANLNGYEYYENSGLTLSADFVYQLTLGIFNNDYSYGPDTGIKTNSIKGFVDRDIVSREYILNEYDFSSHLIEPSTSLSWDQGKLSLKAGLYLPVALTSEKDSPMILKADDSGDLEHSTENIERSSFIFSFSPRLDMAAQYRVVPNKFNINIGGCFQQQGIGWTATDYTEYTRSGGEVLVKDNGQFKRHETNWGNFSTTLRAGFTFFFSENFALDAATGIRSGRDINVFGTGADSITNFGSIMVMVTF